MIIINYEKIISMMAMNHEHGMKFSLVRRFLLWMQQP